MDIVVWISPTDMPEEAQNAFSAAGGWDDDCDWIMFVPTGKAEPMFIHRFDVNRFATNKGVFFAYYHS